MSINSNKQCALFDLDGTLIDTSIDLGRATAYTLEKLGRRPKWSNSDYLSFVGNGARKLLERAFENSLTDAQLDEALEIFKARYNVILNDNAYVYEEIKQSLEFIKEQGIKLAVVTNKPHSSAVIMVEHFFGKGYFDFVIGAVEDKPKKPDPYSALQALRVLNCRAEESLFFGDSDVDVFTAKNSGIYSVGCLWGFRSREVLENARPDAIIDNPKFISNFFEKSVDK